MKKGLILVTLLFIVLLGIDSYNYLDNYQKSKDYAKKLEIQYGYQVGEVRHLNIFEKTDDYLRHGISSSVSFFMPIFAILIGCFLFHKKTHSGFFKHEIIRKPYKNYIWNEIIYSWKAVILIPIFLILCFLASGIVTNFNFDYTYFNNIFPAIDLMKSGVDSTVANILYLLLLFVNLSIGTITCINVGLVFMKKNHNFLVATVFAYLFIIVYQIVAEIIAGPILSEIFNNTFFANNVTYFALWLFSSFPIGFGILSYNLLLFGVTILWLWKSYKNKEDVIIYAEK